MKRYRNLKQSSLQVGFSRSFSIILKKIETVFFNIMCVMLIIISYLNPNFTNKISSIFVNISIPIASIASSPFNSFSDLIINFSELSEARKENQKLQEEIIRLKKSQIKALHIYRENIELRKILNFATAKSSNFKVAKIIGRASDSFNQKLFINAGQNQNIKQGSIVTGKVGVIGRIADILENKSRLILLNDANSKIPVIASESGARAILAGNGGDLMTLEYLAKNHNIKVGELIFTSGDGDTLPPSLLVGVVKKVDLKNNEVFVAMAESTARINHVLILEY